MKKLLLLLMAVALLCPKETNAQDGKGSIHFVPYVGVNYSDFSDDSDYFFGGTSGKVNFMAGARFEFQIADKSAIIADVNYRRLGATADAAMRSFYKNPINGVWCSGYWNRDYNKDEIFREVKENQGSAGESKKVTVDCVSFAVQFKQNIINGLSARVGVEGMESFSKKRHYHEYDYRFYQETGKCDESDETSDADDYFSDHINVAIPLGVTYDYKNFSINATYHLPLTKCSEDRGYSMKHQAFDITVGYRLPLRKR